MNPFDNLKQQPQDDSGQDQAQLFNLPTDFSDIFQQEQPSETEQFFTKSISILKLACVLFVLVIGSLCLFLLTAPFMRFMWEFTAWAFKKTGGIF